MELEEFFIVYRCSGILRFWEEVSVQAYACKCHNPQPGPFIVKHMSMQYTACRHVF
jgi:hypothetical protein